MAQKSNLFRRFWNWRPKEKSNIFLSFLTQSSCDGLKYLGSRDVHIVSRILWLCVLLFFITFAVEGMLNVVAKYNANPVMVSFHPDEIYLEQIPFPAVTICSVNNLRKSETRKIVQYQEQYANGADSEEVNDTLTAILLLQTICESARSFSSRFNGYRKDEIVINQTKMNMIDTNSELNPKIIEMLAGTQQNCSEMIQLCSWNNQPEKCEELFQEIYTDYGPCCVFNMMPVQLLLRNTFVILELHAPHKVSAERLEKWNSWNIDRNILALDAGSVHGPPRHQRHAGVASGLSFLVNPEINEYFCPSQDSLGFQLVADSPIDFPKVNNFGVGVQPNTETFLNIFPELTMIDPDIQDLPLDKRHCYFKGEFRLRHFKFYTTKNCLEECLSNLTYLSCHCTLFNMPRSKDQKVCLKKAYPCAVQVQSRLAREGKVACRACLPACTQIHYAKSVSKLPMNKDQNIWRTDNSSFPAWARDNVSVVHVYFGTHSVYSRVRRKIYGIVDLIGDSGGILSLYIGCSLVSILELFYHFIFHALFKIKISCLCAKFKSQKLKRRVGRSWLPQFKR